VNKIWEAKPFGLQVCQILSDGEFEDPKMIGNLYFEQVWFPGVHADIGGGYLENEARLSDIALGWMVAAASIIPDGLKHDGSVLKLWPYPRTFVAAPKDPVRNIVVSPKSAFSLASTDARCEAALSVSRCDVVRVGRN